jgi:hypothetical protein
MEWFVPSNDLIQSNEPLCQLSIDDINADWSQRQYEYIHPFDCLRAAAHARLFFKENDMYSEIKRGILYSPTGRIHDLDSVVHVPDAFVYGEAYALMQDSCIWEPQNIPSPMNNVKGYTHYVTVVQTAEGKKVAVDWNISQFYDIPTDLLLYIP